MQVERIFSGLLFLVSLVLLYVAWGYTAPIAYDPIGPRPYPMLLLSLLAIMTAILTFRPARFVEVIDFGWSKPVVKNLVVCGLVMLFYGVLFEVLGYIIATTLMAWGVGILFKGQVVKTFVASAVMALLTYLLFDKVLDVTLPMGLLSFMRGG